MSVGCTKIGAKNVLNMQSYRLITGERLAKRLIICLLAIEILFYTAVGMHGVEMQNA